MTIRITTPPSASADIPEEKRPDPKGNQSARYPFEFAFWASVSIFVGVLVGVVGIWYYLNVPLHWLDFILIPSLTAGGCLAIYGFLLMLRAASNTFGSVLDLFGLSREKPTDKPEDEKPEAAADVGSRIYLALYIMTTDFYFLGEEGSRRESRIPAQLWTLANEILQNPYVGLRVGTGKGQRFVDVAQEDRGEIFQILAAISVGDTGQNYSVETQEGTRVFTFAGKAPTTTPQGKTRKPKKTTQK